MKYIKHMPQISSSRLNSLPAQLISLLCSSNLNFSHSSNGHEILAKQQSKMIDPFLKDTNTRLHLLFLVRRSVRVKTMAQQ